MLPGEIFNKRIILSPLNWGIGHVARCIPLINTLLSNGNKIFIACNEDQRVIFEQYFLNIQYINHAGYPFKFGKMGNFSLDLARQFRQLNKRLKDEEREVDQYINEFHIDIIISDHRYGFNSKKVHSIFLTHQINLPIRWFEKWVQKIHIDYLKLFNEIWVPDTIDSDYSGNLSKPCAQIQINYIGILSRFQLYEIPSFKTNEKTIIISGPTVYAEKYAKEQLRSERNVMENCVMILPESIVLTDVPSNFKIQGSTNWQMCDQLILNSKKIVSRCGYSTLMDLGVLKVPFEITPTPGQREQEYLFDLWNKKSLNQTSS